MFRISDSIRSTSTQDGEILLDVRQGQILALNRTGSRIFQMLERGLDPNQIADEISREFAVNIAEVHADVLGFIESLEKCDVLKAG